MRLSLEDPVVITCAISGALADREQCLEDNLYLPWGEMARSNGDLVAKARQMTQDVGRRPATVSEARELLGVPERELTRREMLTGEGS
jgi:uncharacterized protein (DUF849 family)